jgi:hypothetical protein
MLVLLVACLVQALIWSALTGWPTVPTELLLVPATFLHLCGWGQLVNSFGPWWPASPTLACLAVPVAMVLAVTGALSAIAPAPSRPQRNREADHGQPSDQTS